MRGLLPQVHSKAVLHPVFASAHHAGYLAAWLSTAQAVGVLPAKAHGARDRVGLKERGCLHEMSLDIWQQFLQTLLLRLPEQAFPALCVITVIGFAMLH